MGKIENDRIARRVYVRECAGSRSISRLRKRWFDTVKKCLRKRGLDVRQAWCMTGVCEGEYAGCRPGDEPLTLTRC